MTNTNTLTPIQLAYVNNNLALAQFLAHKYWPKIRKYVDFDEALQAAYMGLIDAASKFDADAVNQDDLEATSRHPSGKAFSGYAGIRIVGVILDLAHKYDRVPKRQRQLYNKMIPHRTLPIEEIAVHVGLSPDQVHAILIAVEQASVSLDESLGDDLGSLHEIIPSAVSDTEHDALIRIAQRAVYEVFTKDLTSVQQELVKLVVYDGLSVSGAASLIGMSASRATAAYKDAVIRMYDVVKQFI